MDFNLIYLSLGSNIGDKLHNIEKAIDKIRQLELTLEKKSSLYETEPWGNINQEEFINQVIAINTIYEPKQLLEKLLMIELELGRIRNKKNDPRIIDIDILFFKDMVITKPDITIPHPRMHLRKFILVPMTEIAANNNHPVLHKSMNELLNICEDHSCVKKLSPYEIKSE